jgi:hypothetical protein
MTQSITTALPAAVADFVLLPDTSFHVCIGGIQIGDYVESAAAAQAMLDEHLSDGVPLEDLSVETYAIEGGERIEAAPYFVKGRWHLGYEPNTLVTEILSKLDGVEGEVVVYIAPFTDPYGRTSRPFHGVVCDVSEVRASGANAISAAGRSVANLRIDQWGHPDYHNDGILVLPRVVLAGDALSEALDRVRRGLALIATENNGRVAHRFCRYSHAEMPVADVVVSGDVISTCEETFDPRQLVDVMLFEKQGGEGDDGETVVECWFADGRALRLRGGFDWFNACC